MSLGWGGEDSGGNHGTLLAHSHDPLWLDRSRAYIFLLQCPSTCGYPYPYAQLEAQKRFVSVSVTGRITLAVASLEGGLSVTRPGGGRVVNR
jgi:hypothetical protein